MARHPRPVCREYGGGSSIWKGYPGSRKAVMAEIKRAAGNKVTTDKWRYATHGAEGQRLKLAHVGLDPNAPRVDRRWRAFGRQNPDEASAANRWLKDQRAQSHATKRMGDGRLALTITYPKANGDLRAVRAIDPTTGADSLAARELWYDAKTRGLWVVLFDLWHTAINNFYPTAGRAGKPIALQMISGAAVNHDGPVEGAA